MGRAGRLPAALHGYAKGIILRGAVFSQSGDPHEDSRRRITDKPVRSWWLYLQFNPDQTLDQPHGSAGRFGIKNNIGPEERVDSQDKSGARDGGDRPVTVGSGHRGGESPVTGYPAGGNPLTR